MKVNKVERIFKFNGRTHPDPLPGQSVAEVQRVLSATEPELSLAAVEGPVVESGKQVYRFSRAVGTKG